MQPGPHCTPDCYPYPRQQYGAPPAPAALPAHPPGGGAAAASGGGGCCGGPDYGAATGYCPPHGAVRPASASSASPPSPTAAPGPPQPLCRQQRWACPTELVAHQQRADAHQARPLHQHEQHHQPRSHHQQPQPYHQPAVGHQQQPPQHHYQPPQHQHHHHHHHHQPPLYPQQQQQHQQHQQQHQQQQQQWAVQAMMRAAQQPPVAQPLLALPAAPLPPARPISPQGTLTASASTSSDSLRGTGQSSTGSPTPTQSPGATPPMPPIRTSSDFGCSSGPAGSSAASSAGTGGTRASGAGGTKTKVFVGQLPRDVTREQLQQLMAPFGTVVGVKVLRDRDRGVGEGAAFVTFGDPESGRRAVDGLDGRQHMQGAPRPLHVCLAEAARREPTAKLYVNGLPPDVSAAQLEAACRPYGSLAEVVMLGARLHHTRSCAFVRFDDHSAAAECISALSGKPFPGTDGRPIRVKYAELSPLKAAHQDRSDGARLRRLEREVRDLRRAQRRRSEAPAVAPQPCAAAACPSAPALPQSKQPPPSPAPAGRGAPPPPPSPAVAPAPAGGAPQLGARP
eukprot:TRINITY_DN4839_c0_g1_i1.p1 TRINITY_DN4839_c0_g1~~TRINITY_DN4839_c0_g1_i1.p1  ORF type:complete len:566 (+),score=114.94 TRINITY_DN4839_c0_g1_i1:86-1783(+)